VTHEYGDGKLELAARSYAYDPELEKAADLFDRDPRAWARLPVILQDRSGIYRDFRQSYFRAVAAGAIPDDRGPAA
jgi:hypothetical protein